MVVVIVESIDNFLRHETVDGVEKPSKCLLLDLAVTRWASPATDLAYFLFLSTPPNLRLTHQEEFLGHYHDTFVSTMHKLGFDPSIYSYRYMDNLVYNDKKCMLQMHPTCYLLCYQTMNERKRHTCTAYYT